MTENADIERSGQIEFFAAPPIAELIEFDQFWQLYPRKVAKKEARKAWAQIGPAERAAAIDCIEAHTRMWWAEGRSSAQLPHAATWLRGERWEDEVGYVAPRAEVRPGRAARNIEMIRSQRKEIGR